MRKSLFVVIEGLDGSGKTSAGRRLRSMLEAHYGNRIKSTYEPHDPSCGGVYIRQVLMKKITDFHPRVLALAFAANRLDHCAREITPFLTATEPHIIISDRYYLSSLVYQSAADFSFEKVMEINEKAIKPDLIFFLNVSNEVCYSRMNIRNQPKELFETNLEETREKYLNAIDFLRKQNDDKIIEVDGSLTIDEVANTMLQHITAEFPEWTFEREDTERQQRVTSSMDFETVVKTMRELSVVENLSEREAIIRKKIADFDLTTLEHIFLKLLESNGVKIGKALPATTYPTYELSYHLPHHLAVRGAAIIFEEQQQYDALLRLVTELEESVDFLYVFSPEEKSITTDYFERDRMQFKNGETKRFPSTKILTTDDLVDFLMTHFT